VPGWAIAIIVLLVILVIIAAGAFLYFAMKASKSASDPKNQPLAGDYNKV